MAVDGHDEPEMCGALQFGKATLASFTGIGRAETGFFLCMHCKHASFISRMMMLKKAFRCRLMRL